MKKTIILAIVAAIFFSCSTQKPDNRLTMLVGSYTAQGSEGIYSFKFDQDNGSWELVDSVKAINPSFLTISENNDMVYAVNETGDDTAAAEAFIFDEASGKLTSMGLQKTAGEDPCYIATDGHILLTANYTGGSISVFPVRPDGSLSECSQLLPGEGGGPFIGRQETAHAHCTVFSPDGKYVLASDFGSDRILRFTVKEDGLEPDGFVRVRPGTGPRHIIFSADCRFVYVIGELSGEVSVFSYYDGQMEEVQVVDCDPVDAAGSADIHLSPDGKFLYASNRLANDGICIFSVDKKNGSLNPVGYQETGIHPRNFAITPNGKYLLCTCRDDNTIQVFSRDAVTGLLSDTGNDIKLSMPVNVVFAHTPTVTALEDIRVRDPFILCNKADNTYYMYRSRYNPAIRDYYVPGGVEVFKSKDLQNWEGPKQVMQMPKNNWAQGKIWAPEVHEYKGKYYLFCTANRIPEKMLDDGIKTFRGVQLFRSDSPEGPFEPFALQPHTPFDELALDGTLWVEDGTPYMIYCHEWVQITDGAMKLMELKKDLSAAAGEPVKLFNASEAAWSTGSDNHVTDGCFLYRTKNGRLLMIWSSYYHGQYAVGIAESESGKVTGPWKQNDEPLFSKDGGHGMLFKTFDNRLFIVLHSPNSPRGMERAKLIELEDTGDSLIIKQ